MGEINPQRLFHRDPETIEENQGQETDSRTKRAILGPGIEVFLKDSRGKLGYKIPEGKKLEVFFTIKKEIDRQPLPIEIKFEKEKKEKGEKDGRIFCIVMDLYRKNEQGEDVNDLDKLQLEKQDSKAAVGKGSIVWCYPKDLEKNLKPGGEQENEEVKIMELEEEAERRKEREKWRRRGEIMEKTGRGVFDPDKKTMVIKIKKTS